MLPRNRKALLLLTLAGIIGLAMFAPAIERPENSPPLAAATRNLKGMDTSAPARAAEHDRAKLPGELHERGTLGELKEDLFSQQSWQRQAPTVVVASRPAPPPMPYRFAGRLLQDGKLQVFVSKGDIPVSIKVGDTLEGGYLVEAITTEAIALIYPPLKHRTSIAIPLIMPAAGSIPPSNSRMSPATGRGSLPAQAAADPPLPATQSQPVIPAPGNPASKPK